ncbi:hypothetical protein Tco_1440376 [Tanacetum coccineum]
MMRCWKASIRNFHQELDSFPLMLILILFHQNEEVEFDTEVDILFCESCALDDNFLLDLRKTLQAILMYRSLPPFIIPVYSGLSLRLCWIEDTHAYLKVISPSGIQKVHFLLVLGMLMILISPCLLSRGSLCRILVRRGVSSVDVIADLS